jgi:phosphate transport system permease protein
LQSVILYVAAIFAEGWKPMKKTILILWAYGCGVFVMFLVAFIFLYILGKGGSVITPDFILQYPQGTPLGTSGGIFPAIVGSLYIGCIAACTASLFSISTAIYLTFYCRNAFLYELNRFTIQCMSGIPSILIGLFGYSFFLMNAGIPRSVLSAGLTLAVMIIPFMVIQIEKTLLEFPKELVESSLALGVSLVYTLFHLVLPLRWREIASSVALATAYAMGATAPIMYTGTVLYTGHLPSLTDPFMALPYHLYVLVNEGYSLTMAYGTAFVLLVILLVIQLICRFPGKRRV